MGIFLAYGLSLELVGSGVGITLGLCSSATSTIAAGGLAHRPADGPSIYYFYKIPAV